MKKGIYEHYKGKRYRLLSVATHSETLEKMIVYEALYEGGGIWVRPYEMWDELVLVNGEYVLRFKFIEE